MYNIMVCWKQQGIKRLLRSKQKIIVTMAENISNSIVSRGKKHKFQGMDKEFLANKKTYLFMKDYI